MKHYQRLLKRYSSWLRNNSLLIYTAQTVSGADEKTALWYEKVFQWIVDSLFDRMILLEEEDKSVEFINCLATVYCFTKSCPNLLRESHMSMLQPCLSISEDVSHKTIANKELIFECL
jgi:hypothetical protein